MKCKAGKNWGQNVYKCCQCGKAQQLNTNEDVLQICSCGNDEFNSTIVFERSNNGNNEKLLEIIRILEISIFLCDALKLDAFFNVIAVQLRILLCDPNRVLRSTIQKPMLHLIQVKDLRVLLILKQFYIQIYLIKQKKK